MTSFITNLIANSARQALEGVKETAGEYAGGAISSVGSFVEDKGRAIGDGVAHKFKGLGSGVTNYRPFGEAPIPPNLTSSSSLSKPSVTTTPKVASAKPKADIAKTTSISKPKISTTTVPSKPALPATTPTRKTGQKPTTSTTTTSSFPKAALSKPKSTPYYPSAASKPINTAVKNPVSYTAVKAQPTSLYTSSNKTVGGKVVPSAQSLPKSLAQKRRELGAKKNPTVGAMKTGHIPYSASAASGVSAGSGAGGSKAYQGPLELGGLVK